MSKGNGFRPLFFCHSDLLIRKAALRSDKHSNGPPGFQLLQDPFCPSDALRILIGNEKPGIPVQSILKSLSKAHKRACFRKNTSSALFRRRFRDFPVSFQLLFFFGRIQSDHAPVHLHRYDPARSELHGFLQDQLHLIPFGKTLIKCDLRRKLGEIIKNITDLRRNLFFLHGSDLAKIIPGGAVAHKDPVTCRKTKH